MPNIALIPRRSTRISALTAVVDGYPETVHQLETTTGGEPLEDGRDVTDHAVAREEKLTLTGWVSDFGGEDRPGQAWERLREIHRELEPIDVQTEWGRYPEMLIVRAEGRQEGKGLRFTLELRQVIRVGLTDSNLPADNLSGPAAGRSGIIERGRVSLPSVRITL